MPKSTQRRVVGMIFEGIPTWAAEGNSIGGGAMYYYGKCA